MTLMMKKEKYVMGPCAMTPIQNLTIYAAPKSLVDNGTSSSTVTNLELIKHLMKLSESYEIEKNKK